MAQQFKAGELAQIKQTGEIVTINKVSQGLYQTFYLVYQDGKKNRYKESELAPYVDKEERILLKLRQQQFSNAESFQKYAYYRLFSENQERNLFSYQGNKIIFNPFQYKPLLKFLSIESDERLLIADEVGVGKTIESGLILDELIARGQLRDREAVMIVCPSMLCRKWRYELKTKFSMDDFFIHDGDSLSYQLQSLAETGRIQYAHSIVSEQLFRSERYQELLRSCLEELGEPFIQLLIVDECHHYRNPGTLTHKLGALLSLCSERVVMLSATPFNLRSDDLFNQLHILNPVLYPDLDLFHQLLQQIRCVNQVIALVKKAESCQANRVLYNNLNELMRLSDGIPMVSGVVQGVYDSLLQGKTLTVKDKIEFEQAVSTLNPIASSFTRTLKKDALEHRVTRNTISLEVRFTPQESEIYRLFLETNLSRYKMLGVSERAFGLILNGLERIAASSVIALGKNIKRYVQMSDDEFAEMISDTGELDKATVKRMKQQMQESYSELLEKIKLIGTHDTKYETLRQLIEDVQSAASPNRRIILFSFYTETLKYLRRRLASDGYRTELLYGKTPEETPDHKKDEDGFLIRGRNEIMRAFEAGDFEILLVSEVGGEGLDFQFCPALINYDLPYNPMRIEQRIGRIDRMGQNADRIIIGNLCVENTVDMIINRVLLARIADAEDLVGELEPIITGELEKINELLITKGLSDREIIQREQELEQRIEKARQVREAFEEARFDLVNDKGFRAEFENVIKRSRISPRESLSFTYSFLKKENGCWCKPITDTAAHIHMSRDLCEKIRLYCRKNTINTGDEIKSLLQSKGDLEIDFDGDAAYSNPDRVHFKPAGTFIRFIVDYICASQSDPQENVFYASIRDSSSIDLDPGRYWLFIYEMTFKGFYESKSFEYFLSNEDGSDVIYLDDDQKKRLLKIVKNSKIPSDISCKLFDEISLNVEDAVEQRKDTVASSAIGKNSVKVTSRIQALKTLSAIRIQNFEDELHRTSGREEKKLLNAIEREQRKVEDKISVLEQKLSLIGTYSLDAICLIDCI